MHGLAPGNYVIKRDDEAIAADVNITLPAVVNALERRRATLTTGKGFLNPLGDKAPFQTQLSEARRALGL